MTKESFLNLTALVVLIILSPFPANAADILTRQKTIVLDPGHGGKDPGLVSAEGVEEKQVTLELAQLIKSRLQDDFNVQLTRNPKNSNQQHSPGTEQRVVLANQNMANLFISFHLHHARPDTLLVFYYDYPDTTPPSPWQNRTIKARGLAQKLAESTQSIFLSAGVKATIYHAPVTPLEGISATAVLIEPLTISQIPADLPTRTRVLQPYADRIAQSIRSFLINH